ncbi:MULTISPECIES: lipopolysaccharide kinase InaA family protein [Stutzerimonas stutzeri group]|uniref:Heptose kinase n=1 Tax=Stutzerimonas frequens TaxID=2968969 RepID=A0ABX6XWB2_9GAMM|nr:MULTISPECIES: lipopolysaccharide kinase InaA family protein [Stutzerimonas stutzeri group]MCQ4304154.1 lipopolysaccharide kinase InaA family protein [Stutzerimonas frequens]PNF51850.1 heptose kinase [Stutzerimonas frequens]QPT18333.1 heptose kinase [Stutzerimonas frequens]WQN28151.1 lipopolysaccharide kinase InaA family protein [Stutzerimonas stutzeri]WRQ02678.1 lipopolysaccharide kinase InaA family protein [Stutzerimonas stutzeri]
MPAWRCDKADPEVFKAFGSLSAVFDLEGERMTSDPLSEVIRVQLGGIRYYVKRYTSAGKGLRRYLGRPRVKAEWQNLMLFRRWGIPTAPIVAYGMERRGGAFLRGALITRELEQTNDLAFLATTHDARLRDPRWVQEVSLQLARSTRAMHDRGFAHNDLKWRNLLVDPQRRLYLIDCPTGAFWHGPFLQRRIVKDLACLDKVAKYQLSRTQRLRFYLQYCQRKRLVDKDKQRIRQILNYFQGRE